MIIRKEIDITKPLTPEQIKMLEEMESSPIQYDEDCPPQTEEQLRQMVRVERKNMSDRSGKTALTSDKEEHINTENPQNKNWDQFERATEMFSDDFMEDGRASQDASCRKSVL